MLKNRYFWYGALAAIVVCLAWKLLVVLGVCGVLYLVWQSAFVDWSGKGDGRQYPNE